MKNQDNKQTETPGQLFDKLQENARKILALLEDRQEGLMSWNMCLGECLSEQVELCGKLGVLQKSQSQARMEEITGSNKICE